MEHKWEASTGTHLSAAETAETGRQPSQKHGGAEERAETKAAASLRMNHSRWVIAQSAAAAYLEY